jgi:hypothetical protein
MQNLQQKKLVTMKNQGSMKIQPLKPLFLCINRCIKQIDSVSHSYARSLIIKASEEIENLKALNLPPLYGVGGTAIGGYEPLKLVDAPYLPKQEPKEEDPTSQYTLVLDLDETLVHYFESPTEGKFNVRPGVD